MAPLNYYLDDLTDEEFHDFCGEAAAITDLGQRLAWARTCLAAFKDDEEDSEDDEEMGADLKSSIPPALLPVVVRLSAEERAWGQQILSALNMERQQKLIEKLSTQSIDEALASIRKMIDVARKRSASAAQRAADVVLNDDRDSSVSDRGAA